MAADVGKIFKHGGSQAIRLPREFRFDGAEEVTIERKEDGSLLLRPIDCDPATRAIRETWATDPRAAFEMAVPDGRRLQPQAGMRSLLLAGVLPIKTAPNGLDTSGSTPPWLNARWSFWIEDKGWLDAWALLNALRHEEYLVMALVGLDIPLSKIAHALSMICGRGAWGGLGGVGWLWAYSQQPGVSKEDSRWAGQIPALVDLGEMARLGADSGGKR